MITRVFFSSLLPVSMAIKVIGKKMVLKVQRITFISSLFHLFIISVRDSCLFLGIYFVFIVGSHPKTKNKIFTKLQKKSFGDFRKAETPE